MARYIKVFIAATAFVFQAYLFLAIAVLSSSLVGLTDAICQAQSTERLKSMLLEAGGTLNEDISCTDLKAALKFRSHFPSAEHRDVTLTETQVKTGLQRLESRVMGRFKKRTRRSIGTTVVRSCYTPLNHPEGTAHNAVHHLCHNCDATTTLPPNYFPRYINQVICDPNKPAVCLQGEGVCKPRVMTLTFLMKSGNCVSDTNGILMEEWVPVVLGVGTTCECMIKTTSFFKFLL
eukprot:gene5447-6129_t